MFKSMTAYGRATHISPLGRFVAELHSVNRKHLEINTFLPPELLRFDAELKRWVSEEVGRGQVNLKITASFDQFSRLRIVPNLPLIRQYKDAWEAMVQDLQLNASSDLFLHFLRGQKEIFLQEQELLEEDSCRMVLRELIREAVTQLKVMKEREGKILHDDIAGRFARLPPLIGAIAAKARGATLRYRQRLLDRLSEVLGSSVENEQSILREVSIYAEKIDIAEELTRFDSHLKQVEELISSQVPGVGKMLEFLLQELNREINTISAKSSDAEVSHHAVEIKGELERIREQIQNIE